MLFPASFWQRVRVYLMAMSLPRLFPMGRWLPAVVGVLILSGVFGLVAEQPLPGVERLKSSPVLRDLRPNPLARPAATPPEQTLEQMYVPDGFRVDLVAGEPRVHQPVAFAWDARGRIWVAEAHS